MRRRLLAALLAVGAGAACRKEPPPQPPSPSGPAASESTWPQAAHAPGPDAGATGAPPAVSEEAARGCRNGLAEALKKVEAVPAVRRLKPALEGIGAHCEEALGGLARASIEAAAQDYPLRAETLSAAATPLLPPTCAAGEARGPALEVSYACPPPEAFGLAEPLLGDLDAGSYRFALALRERLGAIGALDAVTDRLLSNLVLAAALEGERRRTAR